MKGINGRSLVQLSDRAVFDKWVLDQLSHLTKLGLPTEGLDREMHVLSRILKVLAPGVTPAYLSDED